MVLVPEEALEFYRRACMPRSQEVEPVMRRDRKLSSLLRRTVNPILIGKKPHRACGWRNSQKFSKYSANGDVILAVGLPPKRGSAERLTILQPPATTTLRKCFPQLTQLFL